MLQTIINAIQNKQILSFQYDGLSRIVEPHAVGISTTGKQVMRCFQIDGQSSHPPIPDWRLMSILKIQGLSVVVGQHFISARPGYKSGDSAMTTIYAQL